MKEQTDNKAKTICIKCKKMADAILGVFDVLCSRCLEEKEAKQKVKHPSLFKEK